LLGWTAEGGCPYVILVVKGLTRAGLQPQDFLGAWKDADPDVPLLKQAQAEYAKVQ
jgi:hypothetical protein